jgi:hypothetical protein
MSLRDAILRADVAAYDGIIDEAIREVRRLLTHRTVQSGITYLEEAKYKMHLEVMETSGSSQEPN